MELNKSNTETWKERLVEEQEQLKEKFIKLVQFINSDKFFALSNNNKQLLQNQKIAMEMYLNTLNLRIYEDVDKISVPNYGLMGIFGSVMTPPIFEKEKEKIE